jgi:DNA mismatch endonuclease (patch repair protein)
MSRVRVKSTDIEELIGLEIQKRGHRFRKNVKDLPGKPDIVFRDEMVAVFVDGDFWHGYRFPSWRRKVPKFWRIKIAKNRERDRRNFRKLRRNGWTVVRLWQHEVERDLDRCVDRVVWALQGGNA